MAYAGLGSRAATAAPDLTGNNPGQLTTVFDPGLLAIFVPWAELYRAVVLGCTAGTTGEVYVEGAAVSYNVFGTGAEWDPSQPPLIQPGQSVFFYWSLAVGAPPPKTTLWFRYDPDVGVPFP